jgi:DNA gyrase subunit A
MVFELKGKIKNVEIESEMQDSYLSYAMSVIVGRALPDIRDGLKPVHRRILYAMQDMGMRSNTPFKKSARIVGEVLGKYHPHGDTAVYDAMVRMAQDFSQRYMMVDGHGNFGSVDGDRAAAMRYTEARLSSFAEELLIGIEKDTVDFVDNFDSSLKEPAVLPSKVPNLLVNGSSGIAVGMATNIPPHNLSEVIEGIIYNIDHPEATVKDLMKKIKGPDFPTGGIIMGLEGIREAYETGRGRLVVRGRVHQEQPPKGKTQVIISELPYQVNKARFVEKIAELVRSKKLEGISDLRDESDRSGMRVVVELKKDSVPLVVINSLYKNTQLQDTFGVIMLSLVDGIPKTLNLKGIIVEYVKHRYEVIVRRTKFELRKAEEREHILAGYLIALDNLDEVIKTIRSST